MIITKENRLKELRDYLCLLDQNCTVKDTYSRGKNAGVLTAISKINNMIEEETRNNELVISCGCCKHHDINRCPAYNIPNERASSKINLCFHIK